MSNCAPVAFYRTRGRRDNAPVLAKALAALLGELGMSLARLPEHADLLLVGRLGEERLHELDGVRLHGADRLRAPMQEALRHRGLVRALDAPVEAVVRRLERHLHERVGREAVRGDEVLPVRLELERLAVVLADQVAQARLCKPDTCAQLGVERPLELLRRSVDNVRGRGHFGWMPTGRLVGFGVR